MVNYSAAYTTFFKESVLPKGRVLDVGTGTGSFARAWLDAGGSPDLTLLDPSTAMLARARRNFARIGLTPRQLHCGFGSLSRTLRFDVILASHVLEHLSDPGVVLKQLANLLPSGGQLYLTDSKPHWCNWVIWLRFQHRWFVPEVICNMGREAGLVEIRVSHFEIGPPSRTSLGYVFSKP